MKVDTRLLSKTFACWNHVAHGDDARTDLGRGATARTVTLVPPAARTRLGESFQVIDGARLLGQSA